MKYKFLEHTADIKFQAFGESVEDVFKNSLYAMFYSMSEEKIKSKISKKIKIDGKDFESLLYNFLEEFLFLLDSEGFFLSKVNDLKIDSENFVLEIEVEGDLAENYNVELDIKAITYNDMFVKREGNRWISQVVLDV